MSVIARTNLRLNTSAELRLRCGVETILLAAEQVGGEWIIRLSGAFDALVSVCGKDGKPYWSIAAPLTTSVERVI